MAGIPNVLLRCQSPLMMAKRYRGKINIQRPRPPHYEKQLLLDFTKPVYKPNWQSAPEIKLCSLKSDEKHKKKEIDNPFERILANECLNWFNTSKMVIFIHMNSMTMEDSFPIFATLKRNKMNMRKYGKKIVSMATTGTRYETVNCLFNSHQNIIFGQPENLGKLFKILKKAPQMIVMAGIIEDQLMSKNELLQFSQLPSLDVARSQLCTVLTSTGSSITSQLQLSQQALVAHLDKHVELNSSPESGAPESGSQNSGTKESGGEESGVKVV